MTIAVANVNLANTFSHWLTRTNELAHAMSVFTVTVDSNAAIGNAAVHGTFSANTVKIDSVSGFSGANISIDSAQLIIANTSSVNSIGEFNVNGQLNVAAVSTIKIQGSNTTHRVLSAIDANGTIGFIQVEFPLDQLTDVDTTNVVSKNNETIIKWNSTSSKWEANTLSLIDSVRINSLNVGTVTSVLTVSSNTNIGSNTLFVNTGNRRVGIGMTNPSATLSVNGAITATGEITGFYTSDAYFKDNIFSMDTTKALDVLLSIDVTEFDWNEEKVKESPYVNDLNQGHDVGLIAQQLQGLGIPGLVHTRPDGTLAVNYIKLIPYLIGAVQKIQHEVNK